MVSNSIKSEEHHLHKPTKNQFNIQVRTSTVCKTNNIQVDCSQKTGTGSTQSETPSKVPNLLVANVMSFVPKVDEVGEFIFRRNITIAFITETWLKETVSDGVVDIPDFAVLRQDRKRDLHGGVCAYIKEGYCRYKHLKELNCRDEHESLWLHLRPTRLPRGFSCIIAAVIYHPPKSDDRSFREHLFQSLTLVESKYPNCGILVTGDFNRLDIGCLLRHFRLNQIVKEHTRNDATLDLILTNMHDHYSPPQPFAPLGLSDHNVVVATPLHGKRINKKTITKRDLRASSKASMGRFLNGIDWSILFSPHEGCKEMWNVFSKAVCTGLDILMPEKQFRICTADAPWMTQRVKALILKRQKAFTMHGPESS